MDTIFFFASKLLVFVLKVETWLIIGMVLSLFCTYRNRRHAALRIGGFTVVAFVILGMFPFGEVLLRPLEARYPPVTDPPTFDGMIVLGGAEENRFSLAWGQPQISAAAERLTATAVLARANPSARVVFSGWDGRWNADADAAQPMGVGPAVLLSLGVSPDQLTWENRARNTAENAQFTYDLIDPTPDQTWIVITSAFHMHRAIASFRTAGWVNIVPYPVDFRSGSFFRGISWQPGDKFHLLNRAIHERVGALVYRITGR